MRNNSLKVYNLSQLALRNGREMKEIWCAYKEKIYDLQVSKLWRTGQHYEHWAGGDLTEELKNAPHGEKVFEKFKIVGTLRK
jgi:predicted heme/steroid binding protein